MKKKVEATESREAVFARQHIEAQRILHELEVHQVELELTNHELKKARDDAEEMLEKYAELYDYAPIGYLTLDSEGTIHELNLAAAAMLGKDRANLRLRNFHLFLETHSKISFRLFLEKLFMNPGSASCDLELTSASGHSIFTHADAAITGNTQFCRIILSDVSERRSIDETQLFLVKSGWSNSGEDFFQSLAKHLAHTLSVDYVCIDRLLDEGLEAQTVAVYFDGKFEDNVRYTLKDTPCGDVVGRRICCFPKGVRHQFPKDTVLQDMHAESYAGTTLWDTHGNPIGLIAVIGRQPMENQHLAEVILNLVSYRAAGELERRKSENELNAALTKAEKSDQLKSAFLANMSHEIRTPMNAIVGFAGLLTEPGLTEEDRNHYSNIIQSRSDDLMHIINDLLEISRIESGNTVILKGMVPINSVLEELHSIFDQKLSRIRKNHLALEMQTGLTDEEATINTDSFILKQVWSNLIDNAIKFTEAGTIRFGYLPPENGIICCFVSDTGIGIAEENHKVIFEHFRQADMPDPHRYGGTGLGLAICKGSIALLGGDIWVESVPGKGSTFFFTLPYEPLVEKTGKTVIKPLEPDSDQTFNWTGKKILLVEDEPNNMDFLCVILEQTGAELRTAFSGKELQEYYGDLESFHAVLLDIRLPDISGWELAREMKLICPHLPVIVQTAFAMPGDRQKSIDAGCDAYISKPLTKQVLLKAMSENIR